jgi:hypothetical protein
MLAWQKKMPPGQHADFAFWPACTNCEQARRKNLQEGRQDAGFARLENAKNAPLLNAKIARDSYHYSLTTLSTLTKRSIGILFIVLWRKLEQDQLKKYVQNHTSKRKTFFKSITIICNWGGKTVG